MFDFLYDDLALEPGVLTRKELEGIYGFVNDVQHGMDNDYYAYSPPRTYPAGDVSAG